MPKLTDTAITKRLVDGLRPDPSGRDRFIWDKTLHGFGIRMKKTGSASYVVQYRTPEGRTRRLAVAPVGTLAPEEARRLASDRLKEAEKGADPSADRRRLRHALTVGEICDAYLLEARGRIKELTASRYRSSIERHIKPLIGRIAGVALAAEDVARMQIDIAAGKTRQAPRRDETGRRIGRGGLASGGAIAARDAVRVLQAVLEPARQRKMVRENVAAGIRRAPDRKAKRFLSANEIERLGAALRTAGAGGSSATALAAIRLILLTGMRREEALTLPHAWVDARARCIRFVDTKSGPQLRPIGADAVKVIEAQIAADAARRSRRARADAAAGLVPRDEPPSSWVFPGARDEARHWSGLRKLMAAICAKVGIEGASPHVLRHTFAATAAEMGFQRANDCRHARPCGPRHHGAIRSRPRFGAGRRGRPGGGTDRGVARRLDRRR